MPQPLLKSYSNDDHVFEIGIDEVGRGPLFGRVYSACAIIPKKPDFKYEIIKDSKKFSSKKKMRQVYDYLVENLEYYSVSYVTEQDIDKYNILNASHRAMHNAIDTLLQRHNMVINIDNCLLMVDGNNFKPYCRYVDISHNTTDVTGFTQARHVTIEGGDNKYCNIAAASILAKVEHDLYIEDLCKQYPQLHTIYDLNNNKGYGTKRHIDGIKKYGISNWHRKSFSTCRNQPINPDEFYLQLDDPIISNADKDEDEDVISKQTASLQVS